MLFERPTAGLAVGSHGGARTAVQHGVDVRLLLGDVLFVPFVVIDLLVSNVLLALGMQMVPPTMVSLPLKLLLFVVANGWGRLIEALVVSYRS